MISVLFVFIIGFIIVARQTRERTKKEVSMTWNLWVRLLCRRSSLTSSMEFIRYSCQYFLLPLMYKENRKNKSPNQIRSHNCNWRASQETASTKQNQQQEVVWFLKFLSCLFTHILEVPLMHFKHIFAMLFCCNFSLFQMHQKISSSKKV